MNIKKAELTDAKQLQPLLEQLGYNLTLENIEQKITSYTTKQGHHILIAQENHTIIGFITFALYECFVIDGGCMHIESLVIDINHRNKGIGKKLMAAAENYAIAHGCTVAELITLNHRKKGGTHAFYEKLGYEDNIKSDISYFSKKLI